MKTGCDNILSCGIFWAFCIGAIVGCGKSAPRETEVIVYTVLASEVSAPVFDDFTRKTGIIVRPRFDTEATTTAGLTQAILAERERPRCDVFWDNEMLNTLRLERQGLLRAYKPAAAAQIQASARSPRHLWQGFAPGARVLIVNTNQIAEVRRPKSIRDLLDSQWYERCGIAKPLSGTAATHAACLFAAWGDDEAKEFFRSVKRTARVMPDNQQVARAVAAGQLAFGLTDAAEAILEVERGMSVAIVYPDQAEDQLGTLFIPNTLAIINNSPNPKAAEKLVDYLLSSDVERRLAEGRSAQIPLSKGLAASPRVKTPPEVRAMDVDWTAAAEKWDAAAEFLKNEFTHP